MDQPALPLLIRPEVRRRGRPPGAKSKRSLDLAKYVEAMFGGMTPGQQAAQLSMVTPKDLREARAAALELRMVEVDLPPMMLAMAVKARQLARAIGCETKEAWLLLQKERADLMPYIHQRQAQAAPPAKAGADQVTVYLIPDGEAGDQAQLADFSADPDDIEIIDDLAGPPGQVGRVKSDDAP